jgi:glutamine amidotransferase
MCRLLFIRAIHGFDIGNKLKKFADICQNSQEYHGHGWGCAYLSGKEWESYKNSVPIWEDNLNQFQKSTVLIAHARSAFRDRDIGIENNMPFYKDNFAFIFNGELHGVKIKEKGKIGAEKIFNYILRFYDGDLFSSLKKALPIIEKRTRYIKALNMIISDKNKAFVVSQFNEQLQYFTLYYKKNPSELIICSSPFPAEKNWQQIVNRSIRVF